MSDGLNIAVLTVSDTRTADTDTSGQFLEDALLEAGHVLASRAIVVDDIYQIRARLSAWIADSTLHAILVTGGTGFSGRDSTPEAVLPLFDKTIDGFGEVFRTISLKTVGTSAIQSRACAVLSNGNICRTDTIEEGIGIKPFECIHLLLQYL